MKRLGAFFFVAIIAATSASAQGLLNKIKSKANQELNKLENGSSSQAKQPNKNKLSANVTRTVAVTLHNDENFDYQENCIDLGASASQVSFIVTSRSGNTTQCYSYKNGSRTPIQCPTAFNNNNCQTSLQCSHPELKELQPTSDDIKKYLVNETESHNVATPTLTDQQLKTMAAYMTPAQIDEVKKQMAAAQQQTAGQTYSTIKSSTISFNGKKYGPYKQVSKFYLTPDGQNFYAVISESKDANSAQTQNKIISSTSLPVITLGDYEMPMSVFAAADNSDFGYVSYGMSGQKYVIATASKKNFEMPISSGFGGAWFSATGGHVIYTSISELYYDGQGIRAMASGESLNACDIFVTADGKGVTVIKNNTLNFADGDYFEYPLKISIVNAGGKQVYRWLALENREVVIYEKPY